MNILSDNPNAIKNAINDDSIHVHHSPALDVYTKDNQILRTLKGMYFSSKLDLDNQNIIDYIKETAKPADLPEPVCHTCYNYEDFNNFCKEFIDNSKDTIRIAYDVETTAAPYLSSRYKLAGFSLATVVSDGCYVILDSLDYTNPDTDLIIDRLASIIKSHNMLVFNAQHEYIATKKCVGVNLRKDSKHLDDAYSMALLLKTESFKADVFKLKLLCNRLLGIDNWATIIDDYISLAMSIASDETYNFNSLNDEQKEKIVAFRDMMKIYDYSNNEIISFIKKLQDSYEEWKEQDTIPYSLIPSRMIAKYGCYDSCYLLALFDYFENWAKELEEKLSDSLNKPDIQTAYEEVIDGQIMSAILTLNGIFISESRDNEVKEKSNKLSEEHYNKLWEIKSDTKNEYILKAYAKAKFKDVLRKNYILPLCLVKLIPEGFKFIKTTPSFYSFECEITDMTKIIDDVSTDENGNEVIISSHLAEDNAIKVYKKDGKRYCKLLQKHLLPYESLDNEDELIEQVFNDFIEDSLKKDGSLAKNVFKPMSGPAELFDILTEDLKYSKFMSRVILFEYHNLPDKLKSSDVDEFLDENLLYNFNNDVELYCSIANLVKDTVMEYLRKSYPHKEIYENLLKNGLHSFSSPIIAYIYNVFTATGCTVDNPVYSAFDFICQLKICRKYLRINSTFIKGSSGGYASQMKVYNDSINDEFLNLASTKVTDENDNAYYTPDTSSVAFGKWFASTADTGRWQATVHNVPAGAYCKRRFISRYPGGVIMAADMSQMEVRELAMLSNCTGLIETIKDPSIDIHKRTASLAFDVPYDEVTSTQRKQTKEGIFSVVYGREESSLAQTLFKGDKAAAKRLMDAIFKVYPEVREYLDDAHIDAKKHGYLVTRRGAPIYINPFTEKGTGKTESAFFRNANNFPIQGGASWICTNTLVNVQKLIDKYNMNDKIKIICYIHDSIEIDVAPDAIDMAYKIMYAAFNVLAPKLYGVPTKGDVVCGVSMGEELDFKRIEENHYVIEGNKSDVEDLINQMALNYNVEIIKSEIEETVDKSEDINWVFTPRAELKWYDSITPSTFEVKLSSKI